MFVNGSIEFNTPLPPENNFSNPALQVAYDGGGVFEIVRNPDNSIKQSVGVCLSTGVSDESLNPAPLSGFGIGMQGPNNGVNFYDLQTADGEVSSEFDDSPGGAATVDKDFERLVFPTENPLGGDASVLQFQVHCPYPTVLSVSLVYGTDEHPWFTRSENVDYNDSFAIVIDPPQGATDTFRGINIATLTATNPQTQQTASVPFDIEGYKSCNLFRENDTAPIPSVLQSSRHHIPLAMRYDAEFGGLTSLFTRTIVVPAGTHTIKLVVQDVYDTLLDAGICIENGSIRSRYQFAEGDYNLDGAVNAADYGIWSDNFGKRPAAFANDLVRNIVGGDGNNDQEVNVADYTVWYDHFGDTGDKLYKADFNLDGVVDNLDFDIWNKYKYQLDTCASRAEGDANSDGLIDVRDYNIWNQERGDFVQSAAPNSVTSATSSTVRPNRSDVLKLKKKLPKSPDANNDGVVDESDREIILEILSDTRH
ncbi:MAG: choice-of-anchor L domain-containing protein [Pirellulaceae bacterium]